MNYEKPMLIWLGEGRPSPMCGYGSGNMSSGCDDGQWIDEAQWCNGGNANVQCADGSTASYNCFQGTSVVEPGHSFTRCYTGDHPA